jgi:hypothetical protein
MSRLVLKMEAETNEDVFEVADIVDAKISKVPIICTLASVSSLPFICRVNLSTAFAGKVSMKRTIRGNPEKIC